MTKKAKYENYQHYIDEEWSNKEPKKNFTKLLELMKNDNVPPNASLLDIGCASGELLYYLSKNFPDMSLSGADIFDDLLKKARNYLPDTEFYNLSVLDIPDSMAKKFDIVLAIGVMSIFDEDELIKFWDNLSKLVKPGGKIYVLAPLNEYGSDIIVKHRKRIKNQLGDWEKGWNIYSIDTIKEIFAKKGWSDFYIEEFKIGMNIPKREDPVRTWTIKTENNDYQLINGLKIMINHYFISIRGAE